jgi:transcriptional regulator with XRE-family HTH domain
MTGLSLKIRLIRIHLGYSQEYVALQLGISQRAYSKIETGKTKLTVVRLEQISRILECKIEDLISLSFKELLEEKS